MEKKHALFFSLAITLIIVVNYYFLFSDGDIEREKVVIVRAIDGDTVELKDGRKVRLDSINTPERGESFYDMAKEFLESFENKTVELEISGIERYGRVLGKIYYDDELINLKIVEKGLAHNYYVDDGDLNDFIKSQESAIKNGKGIWNKSGFYECINAEINKKEEYVVIENKCELGLEGWSVKDESTRKYIFEKMEASEIVLYSGGGENNETSLYWGRGNVWNNDRDSVFIRDEKGFLVFYDSYGY